MSDEKLRSREPPPIAVPDMPHNGHHDDHVAREVTPYLCNGKRRLQRVDQRSSVAETI